MFKSSYHFIVFRYLAPTLLILLTWVVIAQAQVFSAAQNYARNRAGVVLVKTQLSAVVNVGEVAINNKMFNRLLDSIQQLELDSIMLTGEQKLDIVLREFRVNAGRYFKSTLNYFKHSKSIISSGTGFFVHGSGYIVTNCHVVDEDADYIRRRFILSAFKQVTASNIEAIESAWAIHFNDQQREGLYNTFASVYSRILPIELDSLKKRIYIEMSGGKESNAGYLSSSMPATIVVKGRSMPGKDIAILKVESDTELPTLTIADNSIVSVGENIFVYGFPATVTDNEFLSKETALEPTLTTGIVSAWKKTVEGWPVIQMDADINHGNSGGPVCNEEGNVIGIATFGSLENSSGVLASGFNFAIPVSVLQEYLERAGIVPQQSKITGYFHDALTYYNRGYYRKAWDAFTAIQKKHPSYPEVNWYVQQSEQKIKAGKDKEDNSKYYLFVLPGILLLMTLLWGWLNFKKNK